MNKEISCKHCIHNGDQMLYPSGCTGCGENHENFITRKDVAKIQKSDIYKNYLLKPEYKEKE